MKYKWQVANWVKDFGTLLVALWIIGGGAAVGAIVSSTLGFKPHSSSFIALTLSIYLGPILIVFLITFMSYVWNNTHRLEVPIKRVRVPIKEDLRKR